MKNKINATSVVETNQSNVIWESTIRYTPGKSLKKCFFCDLVFRRETISVHTSSITVERNIKCCLCSQCNHCEYILIYKVCMRMHMQLMLTSVHSVSNVITVTFMLYSKVSWNITWRDSWWKWEDKNTSRLHLCRPKVPFLK